MVDGSTILDHQQLAAELAQELAEEGDDRLTRETLGLSAGEEAAVRGDGADHGAMVATQRGAQDGRLAHRGVRARDKGQQIEARLIYEEDGPLLGPGFA